MPEQSFSIEHQIVEQLSTFAEKYNIKSLFVLGDYCSNIYFDRKSDIGKIEICCAYEDQIEDIVDVLCSEVYRCKPIYLESTKLIYAKVQDVIVEFQCGSSSQYMNNEEVVTWMETNNIENSSINNNIYGRDFTFRSLAYSAYNRTLYDVTKKAIRDLDRKIIMSLLPPHLLIKYNPSSCFDAMYYSLLYDFHISDKLLTVIQRMSLPKMHKYISVHKMANYVFKVLSVNFEGGLEILEKCNLSGVLKLPDVVEEIKRRNRD